VCSAVVCVFAPFVPGGIGRYDEDWNPRAFGDNVTAWGTPVVLIESGGVPPGRALTDFTRLNYVALLTALHRLVEDDLAGEAADLYENLPRNENNLWTDVLEGGRVWQPGPASPTARTWPSTGSTATRSSLPAPSPAGRAPRARGRRRADHSPRAASTSQTA
jgi:hypothetical protein